MITELLAYPVRLPPVVIFTSIVVIVYLLYLVSLAGSGSSDGLGHLANLVQRLRQDGRNTMAVIRRFPRGGAVCVVSLTKRISQAFLSHLYWLRCENAVPVDGSNLSCTPNQEPCKLVNKFSRTDEADGVEELNMPVKANVCLGETAENRDPSSNQQITLDNHDMNAIPPVLPSSDEFDKISEVQQWLEQYLEHCSHLERCFALGFDSTGVMQFYTDLAKSEKETLTVALNKAIMAIKKIKDAISSAQKAAPRAEKILEWSFIQLNQLDNKTEEEKKVFFDKFKKISLKIYERATKIYVAVVEVADNDWNYLPVELQEWLESYARQVFLNTCDFKFKGLFEKAFGEFDYAYEPTGIAKKLVVSVFKAVEENKSRPKLHLLNFVERVNLEPVVTSSRLGSTDSVFAKTAIKNFTQELVKLPNVERVRAVAVTPGDIHSITFQINISPQFMEGEFTDIQELWETAESLALQAHRQLRDSTGEKWYFHTELIEDFSDYPNSNEIIAFAYGQSIDSSASG